LPETRILHKVRFPKFDASIEQGMVGRWLAREGDDVSAGDKLVELVTDKASFEFESEASGTVLKVLAPEKSTVPVGYVLAVIGDPGEAVPPDLDAENEALLAAHSDRLLGGADREAGPGPEGPPPPGRSLAPPVRSPADRARKAPRVRATPRARRFAREHGVDLEALAAKLGGRPITAADVSDAIGTS
jgi:pyruvate dehydrogenase E2 component (dihydrolipoamide acetyltransferase)